MKTIKRKRIVTRVAKLEAIARVLLDVNWDQVAVSDLSRRILEVLECL